MLKKIRSGAQYEALILLSEGSVIPRNEAI
jgi:hypothetical protein